MPNPKQCGEYLAVCVASLPYFTFLISLWQLSLSFPKQWFLLARLKNHHISNFDMEMWYFFNLGFFPLIRVQNFEISCCALI